MKNLERHFITGLIILIPIIVTIWILWKVSIFLEGILGNLFRNYLPNFYAPGLGVFSLILIIILVGAVANNLLGKRLLKFGEGLLARIPFFNKIYLSIKGVSDAVLKKKAFNGVALIEFSPGLQTLAFITSPAQKEIQKESNEKLVSLFVPTVPNITTGFYFLIPEKDLKKLDLSVEDALKLILSLGLTANQLKEQNKNIKE
ncbi:MAG: hypothetical protein COZ37_00870 [bacterium (Candidatus Ratteibacteria) CG_4_10_14_3_um_filter_41_18]|uniref:DUF502 domain-containing protein n=4 Tax=Candidatus Ratteibacteria TaxID=2979319 RepID=A0A2M7E8D9_9BACT|nr:MAG: hypothetical protein AUJ76_03785 [Candidatus Omnitrophica bacterium CG1_02_41_171]PIV63983.1 MAG: hypothetical protein COS11_04660 [bacterium (Candidatus Ratteibacteria) CG01_land_8_20_14_3_00_40_19]PIW34262.1 MAG: hypothetical protein COW28_00200 [bacterium (Candidatus Ratteibacteria) CG15_BIG_FIL_POST_REV_8_21_14_020_41_12]PIW73824.1 MAG: hypothetical protein CO004_03895 [bacterium (Candidatus Ratteibacteria) CG_4_8_14_3_um_filter_41_36]PIX77779.1 MAG: hypothetical protein COZ37_00870